MIKNIYLLFIIFLAHINPIKPMGNGFIKCKRPCTVFDLNEDLLYQHTLLFTKLLFSSRKLVETIIDENKKPNNSPSFSSKDLIGLQNLKQAQELLFNKIINKPFKTYQDLPWYTAMNCKALRRWKHFAEIGYINKKQYKEFEEIHANLKTLLCETIDECNKVPHNKKSAL